MSISVVILTLDEERNLPGALASLRGLCDDVVVFDSFSSDRTCSIAREAGARVVQRRFDDYAGQRQAALTDVQYRNGWVLMLDADERVDASLWAEMVRRVGEATPEVALFRVRRKDHFMGKWLRRSSGYPTWFGRLMRLGQVRIERAVNEHYVTEGRIEYLDGHLLHFPFERGVAHWIERHNQYSTMEASIVALEPHAMPRLWSLLSRDPTVRRKALKRIGYALPLRPLLMFAYLYVLRGGFLDGGPGLRFCALRSVYEFFIDLKVREAGRV
jgi:glycosyltransferase involved in cell wall biosynthesis